MRSNGNTWNGTETLSVAGNRYNKWRFIIFRRKIRPFTVKPFDSSYYYIRSAGGYTMLDVSSWSESVTNRRPSTLKWGVVDPSESDKKLRS